MIGQIKAMENDLIARLEAMPFEEARTKILTRQLGNQFGSDNHELCLSWLLCKDAELRDAREAESLSIARDTLSISASARKWAIIAIIVSATTAIIVAIIQIMGQKCPL